MKNEQMNQQLATVEKGTAAKLEESFSPMFEQAQEWAKKAKSLVVTSEDQTAVMKEARAARLQLKALRVNVEHTRKKMKENIVREGKAIDGMANIIKFLIVPIEEHLQNQEDYPKIQEQLRKEALYAARSQEIIDLEANPDLYNLDEMSQEDYDNLIQTIKHQNELKKAEEERLEKERLAEEEARKLHEVRKESIIHLWNFMPEENRNTNFGKWSEDMWNELTNYLHAEKEAADKKAAEREKKLKQETAKRKKLEAELKKQKEEAAEKLRIAEEAEQKRLTEEKAKKEAERKAKNAPDKKKLQELSKKIKEFEIPQMKNEPGQHIAGDVRELLDKVSSYIDKKVVSL